jgi:hypothetical protein
LIPKGYVPSELRRLEAYRRIASSSTLAHLEQVREDMTSAYGQMPRPVMRLLDLAQVRITLAELGTRTVTVRERDVVFLSHEPGALVDRLRHGVSGQPLTSVAADATIRVLEPKSEGLPHEIYFRPPESYFEPESLLRVLRQRLVPKPAGEEAPPPGAKPEPKSKSKSKAGLSPSSGPGPARDPAARSQLGSPSRPASDRNRRRPG